MAGKSEMQKAVDSLNEKIARQEMEVAAARFVLKGLLDQMATKPKRARKPRLVEQKAAAGNG